MDAPHRREFTFPNDTPLLSALTMITQSGYLASIFGGRATWSAVSGIPLAVVAQEWALPQSLFVGAEENLDIRNSALYLHFNYHAQISPEVVFEILRGFRLKSY